MKNYKITVNGNVYDVTVEETGSSASASAAFTPAAPAPKAAPAPAAAPVSAGTQGDVKISAPMPGKVLSIKVSAGEKVTKGQIIMILEAMKMENEIVASQDGTVASIDVNEGASVEAGAVLATLN
ncbi:MAG: biotin/lipoyl-binding protein [Lachnospiraceae bacterium]